MEMSEIQRTRRNTLGDIIRRSSLRFPKKIALRFKREEVTYQQLDSLINQTAQYICSKGLQTGDRAAVLSRNSLDFVIVTFALAKAGVIMVPINYMLNVEDVAYIMGHAEIQACFVAPEFLAVADKANEIANCELRLRAIISNPADPNLEWMPLRTMITDLPTVEPDVNLDDDDVAQIMYTSGTESKPKGVMLTHKNLIAQYMSVILDGDLTEQDILVHALPLFHSAQLHCFLGPHLYVGASGTILEHAAPALMLETVERYGATQLFCPPTVWIALLRSEDFAARNLSSLQKCYYGAAIMPVEIIKELGMRLPQSKLYNFYGQTEVAPLATVLKPHDQLRKTGSAGKPALHVETKIVDESGNEVPIGHIGEIVHRSSHIMIGYFKDEEKTRSAFQGGWFHSGDLGSMDEEGYITVVDRKKDMIKTGGENVASREIEEWMYQHPKVSEVAVIGIPHPYWIEAVTAIVVANAGEEIETEELLQFCKKGLSSFKVPKFVVVTDQLPRNPSGKIVKRELRRQYQMLSEMDKLH